MKFYIDLHKSHILNKGKLVKRQVTVRKSNGKTFSRWQWVNPNDENTPATSKPFIPDFAKEHGYKFSDAEPEDAVKYYEFGNKKNDEYLKHADDLLLYKKAGKLTPRDTEGKPTGVTVGGIPLSHPQAEVLQWANSHNAHKMLIEHQVYAKLQTVYPDDSHEDLVDKMAHLKEHTHNAPITINFDPFAKPNGGGGSVGSYNYTQKSTVYDGLFNSGEWKGILDMYDSSDDEQDDVSGYYLTNRESIEDDVLGLSAYSSNTDDSRSISPKKLKGMRPAYGAVNVFHFDGGSANAYGYCALVLKPEVKQRSTNTPDDSFNLEPGGGDVTSGDSYIATMNHLLKLPARMLHVAFERLFGESPKGLMANSELKDQDYMKRLRERLENNYIEAQIYGGINLSRDVDHILVPNHWRKSDTGMKQLRLMDKLATKHGVGLRTYSVEGDGTDRLGYSGIHPALDEVVKNK